MLEIRRRWIDQQRDRERVWKRADTGQPQQVVAHYGKTELLVAQIEIAVEARVDRRNDAEQRRRGKCFDVGMDHTRHVQLQPIEHGLAYLRIGERRQAWGA